MINEKISLRTWIEAAADQGVPLHTYLLKLSSEELELSEDAILEQMQTMLQVMEESAAFGLTGVSSHSGLTGGAAKKLQEARQSENYKNILGGVVNDAVAYAMAVGECNAAMGRIVAAPTAGASGVLPGVLLALKQHYNLNERQMAEALVVAGNIGMVIASRQAYSDDPNTDKAFADFKTDTSNRLKRQMLGNRRQTVFDINLSFRTA